MDHGTPSWWEWEARVARYGRGVARRLLESPVELLLQPPVEVHIHENASAGPSNDVVQAKFVLQPALGRGQSRGDGALSHSEGCGDLPVRVAVMVAEHDEGGIAGRKAPERHQQLGGAMRVEVGWGRLAAAEDRAQPAPT